MTESGTDVPFALEAIGITKEYPGVRALDDVSFGIRRGQIHALIGKNGAGKSSLVKIFSGAATPTAGQLRIDGQPVEFANPSDAIAKGIATVYQELSLVPELTLAENIHLGRLPRRGVWIDWAGMRARARELLREFNLDLNVDHPAGAFSVAQQQLIEIARAISWEPRVLMLDEPTSALTGEETRRLFDVLRRLTTRGVALIYISHRLHELREIADEITVLRDGRRVGGLGGHEANAERISAMMFGEIVLNPRPADLRSHPEVVMEVRGLRRTPRVQDVSFTLHRGEILGLAGMLGSGRSEVARMLAGADVPDAGEIIVGGTPVRFPSPAQMKSLGIGMTPENRKEAGFVGTMNIADNLCLAAMRRITRGGVLSAGRQRELVTHSVRDLQIKAASAQMLVGTLSGGNQQKVVVGNWLNIEPRIMLFDEPTRGIDIQAKRQIFQIIWNFSRAGQSSIFVSSELEEMLEVCHRLLILIEGRVVGEVSTDGLSLEQLLKLCTGE